MKYIVLRTPNGEAPVLFPREFLHRWMAERFAPMTVVAAGFVADGRDGPVCYGISSGLKIAARPGLDTELVRAALENDGAATGEP